MFGKSMLERMRVGAGRVLGVVRAVASNAKLLTCAGMLGFAILTGGPAFAEPSTPDPITEIEVQEVDVYAVLNWSGISIAVLGLGAIVLAAAGAPRIAMGAGRAFIGAVSRVFRA